MNHVLCFKPLKNAHIVECQGPSVRRCDEHGRMNMDEPFLGGLGEVDEYERSWTNMDEYRLGHKKAGILVGLA